MVHALEVRIRAALSAHIRQHYNLDVAVVTERPPRIEMGEVATPVCFELAKRLKRAPRQIAQEIAAQLAPIEGVERVEVAGAGYVNLYFSRAAFLSTAVADAENPQPFAAPGDAPKCIVEHTNINPNKAAHIGHLRNAALGDTLVRVLRRSGRRVEVQNYIDNTGVQVADVVIAFLHIAKKSPEQVRALAAQPKFDYYCWDLYASVSRYFEEDKTRLALRGETLQSIEQGHGTASEMAGIVAPAIVRCHLRTMQRLGIEYDLLPRESEILHLKFWDAAFEQLKHRNAIHLAASGKNAGCWVMRMGATSGPTTDAADAGGEDAGGEDDDAKIIVRSNGTVTYVGKDIAYQLWKFGLLGKDFQYEKFYTYEDGRVLWSSVSSGGDPGAPAFGHATTVYNVIDARQAYLQNVVVAGLRALGFDEQADHSIHFSYEIVALTPRCAAELGYTLSEEDSKKPYVEVSGRKGLGVKADDLLDRLESAALAEVDERHPELPESERAGIAHAIAIGALRYFLLKFTRTATIAFDFEDALSFEGETGPYCQYAVVRARNIFRKLREQQPGFDASSLKQVDQAAAAALFSGADGNAFWELVLLAGSLGTQIEAAVASQEPAFLAKYAFQLAQAFNLFYHHHRVLTEEDAAKKTFLLQLSRLAEVQLVSALELLGIESPEKM
ncbi:MAG TPA: arginine--tRNA ligase [Candidatus Dormibacteraeota bacterium]|nr:arginine--tRNA ligase [Candidatus Dormibacteraeota bacterium]